ncbi:MAG: hypothetical protein HOF74_13610 [Gammaproteobacteria bacterium]|jgi:hypothetical protein|nr:hypothetical protein [Gammaproteobacteria bacterium]MBT3860863.1 hypothetical protein [Gammaproteobacteria bacterium]MBT3988386.1 hypothetical protein [Gammaproteobacteria bacterium]MBT4256031.1 hypothetical protein [Gammaproteobacteria bacterium]MBT4581445.1 hypothetical protein [Gammaproteobacteria bacterium]
MKNKSHLAPALIGRFMSILLLLVVSNTSLAQDFVFAPDFPVGSSVPEISAQDQNGNLRDFDELVGEKGMLFMMSRSFDW